MKEILASGVYLQYTSSCKKAIIYPKKPDQVVFTKKTDKVVLTKSTQFCCSANENNLAVASEKTLHITDTSQLQNVI